MTTFGQKKVVPVNKEFKENQVELDSIASDTLKIPTPAPVLSKKLLSSEDALDSEVTYGAQDTQWLDLKTNEMHLYGDAFVKYENYEIKAEYIKISMSKDEAFAKSVIGPDGKKIGKPIFNDGSKEVGYDQLRYNFKTKKGIVQNTVAKEGEFYLLGTKTKFISGETDSVYHEDQVFNSDAIITTCDHETPHYGIHTKKLKLIPGRVAVMGPANLEIAGIPTPLVLPFGFFPIVDGVSSGIIFPQDYDYDAIRGFGLRDFGYYLPISDKIDMKITADYYTRGSYGLRLSSQYNSRYNYSGNFILEFANNRSESDITGAFESNKSYRLDWTHTQDSKAHPYRSLSGRIGIETNNYKRNNYRDANSQFENTYSSNLNFKHTLPGTPFRMSAAFVHSQNTQNHNVKISFPELTLNMNTINPLKRKGTRSGQEKWYEKITLKYDAKVKAYVEATDSTLFTNEFIDGLQYGISQDVRSDVSFRFLKYFNVSPNASLNEIWFFKTLQKDLNPTEVLDSTIVDFDTEMNPLYSVDTSYTVDNSFVSGFEPYRKINTGISMNTQIFGTMNFKKGWLRGIRHVMKPTISFNYSPESEKQYQEYYDTDVRDEYNERKAYNPFSGGIFSAGLQQEQKTINFTIINIFEAKYWSKKDTIAKKFKIFDNITVNGGYNFAADSLKWKDVSVRGNARLFKNLTTVNLNATFTPYIKSDKNILINVLAKDIGKSWLQFNYLNASVSTRLTVKKIWDFLKPGNDKEKKESDNSPKRGAAPDNSASDKRKRQVANQTSLISILEGISINHNITIIGAKEYNSDTLYVNRHSIDMSGTIPLTDNWSLNVQRFSYDFKANSFVYPAFTLSRDLHCWKMNFSWYPSNGSYSFFVGVKSNSLSFLKYNYGQSQFESGNSPF